MFTPLPANDTTTVRGLHQEFISRCCSSFSFPWRIIWFKRSPSCLRADTQGTVSAVTDCLLLKHIGGIRDFGSECDETRPLNHGTFQTQMYGHSCDKAQAHVWTAELRAVLRSSPSPWACLERGRGALPHTSSNSHSCKPPEHSLQGTNHSCPYK